MIDLEYIINEIKHKDSIHHLNLDSLPEGKQRASNGQHTENLILFIVWYVVKELDKDFKVIIGHKDKIKVSNSFGYIYVNLDLHIYHKNTLLLAIESKSYLDSSMAKRAIFECSEIKKKHPTAKCIVIEHERALGDAAHGFISADSRLDKVFTLCKHKRDSNKKRNKIDNIATIKELILYIYSALNRYDI